VGEAAAAALITARAATVSKPTFLIHRDGRRVAAYAAKIHPALAPWLAQMRPFTMTTHRNSFRWANAAE